MSPKLCKLCKGLYIFIPKLQISYLDIRVASLLFLSTFFFLTAFSTRSFVALEKAGKRAAESSGTFILVLFSWGRCIKIDFGCEEDTLFIITVEGIMNALFFLV